MYGSLVISGSGKCRCSTFEQYVDIICLEPIVIPCMVPESIHCYELVKKLPEV